MNEQLSKINGLYIPGDSKSLVSHDNFQYTKQVQRILKWSQTHNEQESNHFPIFGVGYGFLTLLKSQLQDDIHLNEFNARGKLQMNLAHDPKHTYLFDEYEKDQLESQFDKIKFFSDVELGMTMEDMVLQHKVLSSIFMPVCSFDDSTVKNQNEEYVAAIEGIIYPWFGVNYRIDRIQFSTEHSSKDLVDHSREAVLHAQRLSNLFIDEARLSGNEYPFVSEEADALALFAERDAHLVQLPLIQSRENLINSELYLF